MEYLLGQAFGILVAICCFAVPYMKKKRQMLVLSMLANLFVAINLILIGKTGSALIINLIAIIQIALSLFHLKLEKDITVAEKTVFLAAYVILGCLRIKEIADILPIFGSILFMLSVFQRDEQKTRLISLGNIIVLLIYYIIIGSTSMWAQVVSLITTATAYLRMSKKTY